MMKYYLNKQITLEEKYYKKLLPIYITLIYTLQNYIDKRYFSKETFGGIVNKWNIEHQGEILAINQRQVKEIIDLAGNTLKGTIKSLQNNFYSSHILIKDLTTGTNNLTNIFTSKFIGRSIVGASILVYVANIFPEKLNEGEVKSIKEHCINSLRLYVQNSTSQAMTNEIVARSLEEGFTEYLSDNMHDDKVRPKHKQENNGYTWYNLKSPPSTGYPGTEINCRCYIKDIRQ